MPSFRSPQIVQPINLGLAQNSVTMKPASPNGLHDQWALASLLVDRPPHITRRESQVSDFSAFSDSPGPIPNLVSASNNSAHTTNSSNLAMNYDFPQQSFDAQKLAMFRHHRHSSNASEASSSAACHEGYTVCLGGQISASPAPSIDERSTGGSPYVEEPLAMEGEFATMDIRSSPGALGNFLPAERSPSSNEGPMRYDTLTWAKEHAFAEPRQETMLATGGLHPKGSISSLTEMLEGRQQQSPTSQSFDYHHSGSNSSRRGSAQLDPLSSQLNHHLDKTSIPLPSCHHSSSPPSRPLNSPHAGPASDSAPVLVLPATHPTSPSLRLNMNHPDMPNGPSISLTSATPLTAKPGDGFGSPDFQSVLEQITSAQPLSPSSPSSTEQQQQQSQQRQPPTLAFDTVFNNCEAPLSFLSPRPTRPRQRSKSESIAKQNSTMNPSANPSDFYPLNTTNGSTSDFSALNSLASFVPQPGSSLLANFWPTPQATNQASSAVSSAQNSPLYPPPIWQTEGSSSPMGVQQNHPGIQPFLADVPKRRAGGPGYDVGFLQPMHNLPYRRSHSVSHGHRRGSSEGSNQADLSSFLPPHTPPVGIADLSDLNSSRPSLTSGDPHQFGNGLQGMVDTSWISPYPAVDVVSNPSEMRIVSPMGSDACLPSHYSPRSRSYSHSSFESEVTTASMMPIEFKSRTTAATKAAAAKRRKEGVTARYMCDMCGETFTRRYNLRGHQRAHMGEKPFECGFPGCTSRFARAHDQKRHYKLHLGVKDYNCKACGKAFIRLDALQRHHKSDAGHACFEQLKNEGHLPQEYDGTSAINNQGMNHETHASGSGGFETYSNFAPTDRIEHPGGLIEQYLSG